MHFALPPLFRYGARVKDYEKLRSLLQEEDYPHLYIHKFIGLKTDLFRSEVERLEREFPRAQRVGERESSGEGPQSYLAFTFELLADDADEIIELLKLTSTLKDVRIIL